LAEGWGVAIVCTVFFISSQKTLRLDDLALAVYPLWLYGVQPRTLLGQKTAYDPQPDSALSKRAVMPSEPAPYLPGDVPTRVEGPCMDPSPSNLCLSVAGQEDARRALGHVDSHRVVIGLGKEYAGQWIDDVSQSAAHENRSTIRLICSTL